MIWIYKKSPLESYQFVIFLIKIIYNQIFAIAADVLWFIFVGFPSTKSVEH